MSRNQKLIPTIQRQDKECLRIHQEAAQMLKSICRITRNQNIAIQTKVQPKYQIHLLSLSGDCGSDASKSSTTDKTHKNTKVFDSSMIGQRLWLGKILQKH